MTDTKTDAKLELADFVIENYACLVQAIEMATQSNKDSADRYVREDDGQIGVHAKMLYDSAISWSVMAARLRGLFNALPIEEEGDGSEGA